MKVVERKEKKCPYAGKIFIYLQKRKMRKDTVQGLSFCKDNIVQNRSIINKRGEKALEIKGNGQMKKE